MRVTESFAEEVRRGGSESRIDAVGHDMYLATIGTKKCDQLPRFRPRIRQNRVGEIEKFTTPIGKSRDQSPRGPYAATKRWTPRCCAANGETIGSMLVFRAAFARRR